jgi:hypothetical protein
MGFRTTVHAARIAQPANTTEIAIGLALHPLNPSKKSHPQNPKGKKSRLCHL